LGGMQHPNSSSSSSRTTGRWSSKT
jgi:hypothetical protein